MKGRPVAVFFLVGRQVHVHAPRVGGAAVTDAACATLAARHHEAARRRDAATSEPLQGCRDVRLLASSSGGSTRDAPTLSFARLSAVDAGVTARLDVIDESALPALLVYRGGVLAASQCNVCLPSARARSHARDEEREKREHAQAGSSGSGGGLGEELIDRVEADDDLEALADELEDLLDELGLYE